MTEGIDKTGWLNGLPQKGWIKETDLADALGVHQKTLRRQIIQQGISGRIVAGVLLLDVEVFYQGLQEGPKFAEPKPKAKKGGGK